LGNMKKVYWTTQLQQQQQLKQSSLNRYHQMSGQGKFSSL
jgi:hypothetical protein